MRIEGKSAHPEEPVSPSNRRLERRPFETGPRQARSLLRMSGLTFALAGLLIIGTVGSPASAQGSPSFQTAMQMGQVGERYDGYLGFATPPSPALRREVVGINIRRRALYTSLATRRGVTLETAALATGCELLTRVPVGQAYMLQDRIWRRRAPGERLTQPSYCG